MGQTTTRRPVTFDHLRKKEPLERRVPIVLSDEAAKDYQSAKDELGRCELLKDGIEEAQAAVASAEKALKAATVTLRFRSIGRKRYAALVRAHPPTEEQIAEAKEDGRTAPYDAENFSVALIAASCVEPAMTEEQVATLSEEWNPAEYMQLWIAALEVNTQRRVVELGKGSNGTRS